MKLVVDYKPKMNSAKYAMAITAVCISDSSLSLLTAKKADNIILSHSMAW